MKFPIIMKKLFTLNLWTKNIHRVKFATNINIYAQYSFNFVSNKYLGNLKNGSLNYFKQQQNFYYEELRKVSSTFFYLKITYFLNLDTFFVAIWNCIWKLFFSFLQA